MPALTLFGRISVISFLAAMAAAPHAQPAVTAPDNVPSAPAQQVSPLAEQASPHAQIDEQRGDFLMVQREYQAAIKAFATVQHPSASAWNQMGIAYQLLFDTKGAARCYKESLRLDKDNPHTLNNLATLDDARSDFAAAERLYRRAIKVQPGAARVIKNLGVNLLMQHRYAESSEVFSRALALDPHVLDHYAGPTFETTVSQRERAEETYVQARSCARAGLYDCAIDRLRRAFDEGSATRQKVANDDDFVALRRMPEFERILAEHR